MIHTGVCIDSSGKNVLHSAIEQGAIDVIISLIEYQAPIAAFLRPCTINALTNCYIVCDVGDDYDLQGAWTPLNLAASKGFTNIVLMICERMQIPLDHLTKKGARPSIVWFVLDIHFFGDGFNY